MAAEFKTILKERFTFDNSVRYDGLYKICKTFADNKIFCNNVDELIDNAKFVEEVLYKKDSDYSTELWHFLSNIDVNSNVKNKDMENILEKNSLEEILKMSSIDLYPSLWAPILNDLEKQEKAKERSTTDTGIKCVRCKSKDVLISQSQTRSADEGSTIMITCNACGKVKKIGG